MSSNENINAVLRYIEEHIEETMCIKQLAEVAGYSEYHFARIFKLSMGMTVMEYVSRQKLVKSLEEISAGTKIIETALKYGWQSHSSFTKAFTKEFGFCPSLLRAMKITIENFGGNAMNNNFLEKTEIGLTKEELLKKLKACLKNNGIIIEENLLTTVYENACSAYEGVKRYSGEEYVTHTINTAIILAELGAEPEIVLAGMFCDINKKGRKSVEEIKENLPEQIYDIVAATQETDTLAATSDEVILIKLAERLHNMQTIDFMNQDKKQEKTRETIEIFIPLAKKLKNERLVNELNDLALKQLTRHN